MNLPENESITYNMEHQTLQILDLLHTMQEACAALHFAMASEDMTQFRALLGDLDAGFSTLLSLSDGIELVGYEHLSGASQTAQASLYQIKKLGIANQTSCLAKIEYELLPIVQGAYIAFYFFQYLREHPEKAADFFQKDKSVLFENPYVDGASEGRPYKYEVSIVVLAYNKLEYTKMCVESLLKNIPKGLNYELILMNNGSSDGTKEYFEGVHPHKQLDVAVNGCSHDAIYRIVEGEFTLFISNDVIVTPHAIENMLICIRSDPKIAWVVPTTPNVSNLQTIPAQYSTQEELFQFAQQNNRSDSSRWEQRTRLCNPIDLRRNSVFYGAGGLYLSGFFYTTDPVHYDSFPDDCISLLLRRNGYKMMLAKDAYCHHFGSVTLKDEIKQQNEQMYYQEGRQKFSKVFGVEPWGPGFCYDLVFRNRVVDEENGPVDILGINCGLGSNSLKIKEQIKEYCHNTNCTLVNLTDDIHYIEDLRGVSDSASVITTIKELKTSLFHRTFRYIVWEGPFLEQYKFSTLLSLCLNHLEDGGTLFIQSNGQSSKYIAREFLDREELGNGWVRIRKK